MSEPAGTNGGVTRGIGLLGSLGTAATGPSGSLSPYCHGAVLFVPAGDGEVLLGSLLDPGYLHIGTLSTLVLAVGLAVFTIGF